MTAKRSSGVSRTNRFPVGPSGGTVPGGVGRSHSAVAATHAALLLAQGVGRLLRSTDDKGVVAVLDSRLATARYGGFLRASLPPFWETADRAVAVAALQRLSQS